MMRYLVICFLLSVTGDALAIHKVGNKCADIDYEEDPSVDYQPDVDGNDWALTPTDINPSPFDKDAFDDVDIGLDLPLNNYLEKDKYNYDASRSDIGLGILGVKRDGALSFRGKSISTDRFIDPDCVE